VPRKLQRLRAFTLTNSVFWAGKAGASCALALLLVQYLEVPDMVTASFVAVLCCSPAALMGLRVSLEQFAGSAIGGALGTLGVYLNLPQAIGVPLAVSLAMLSTQSIGFYRGTVVAAFTALFVQIISFGEPLETFGYRMVAVCVAAMSAFVVNVLVSSFFYQSLFGKRAEKLEGRVAELLLRASEGELAPMHSLFANISQLLGEIGEAKRELEWRGDAHSAEVLGMMSEKILWLRSFVHLVVDLELVADATSEEVRVFLSYLATREGEAPSLPESAECTRLRLIDHIQAEPGAKEHRRGTAKETN